jgi:type I restriction enzyme M protein
VRPGDIVVSHINAVHGAVAIVDDEHAGTVVTTEYSVCRVREGFDPVIVWQLLRSPEVRADLLLSSTGIGRSRVGWENIAELRLPIVSADLVEEVAGQLRRADMLRREAAAAAQAASTQLAQALNLDNGDARALLAAFKPPR